MKQSFALRFVAVLPSVLALAIGAAGVLSPARAEAQSSVAPYFMVIVDTSGSMDDSTGTGMNSCGRARNKMSDAKCVLQRVFNAYGDVSFGLASFNTVCASGTMNATCVNGVCGCGTCSSTCGTTPSSAQGRIRVPIVPENIPALLSWVDYAGGATCSRLAPVAPATFDNTLELRNHGGTPLEGSMRRVRDYFIGGIDADYPTSPLVGDPFATCRSVNVILLTDGDETCGGNAPTVATALHTLNVPGVGTVNVNTYVIGFGIAPGDADIEAIAHAGRPAIPPATRAGFYATDETSLALAFSQIIEDAVRIEVCDGADNDCDTRIDEGFTLYCNRFGSPPTSTPTPGICTPPAESVCDNMDDNCNGVIDEGLRNACGTCGAPPPEVCNLLDDNCNGAIDEGGVCAGCTITGPEVCNNRDDDCDGTIDGITRACGTDVGECVAGTQLCTAGVFGACSGVGPRTELCNNLDDDCDGVIDGMTQACGTDVGECNPGVQVCTAGVLGACIGAIGPSTERCNALDDDCDGAIDDGNPGGGATCGSSVGVCRPGTIACVGGALTCTGGTSGSMETCDLEDDDCDGRIDEGNPGGGASCGATDVGACEFGTMRCIAGMVRCDGAVGPAVERCNTLDDDCDGMVDEGNPEGGASCGDDTGACLRGTTRCIGGTLTCDGSIGPAMETCNGIDDDCDGAIDDEIPVGAACGSDVGECDPGVFACNPTTGMLECIGEVPPSPEVCDLLDNDCNGVTDDGLPDGAACGSDVGECTAGVMRCVGGSEICVGEVTPGTEVCDCLDNDCDGSVDEEAPGTDLCPGTSACIADACDCASTCVDGEFGFECPGGTVPMTVGTMCFCVGERCNAADCGTQTIDSGGAPVCAPGSTDVASCVCRNNTCTFPCDGVTCGAGTVCDPRDPRGRCVEDSCRGLGCPAGEVCDFATGACEADACVTAGCAADEACRDGTCLESCARVTCPAGESCHDGACETDLCAGVGCGAGRTCDPADGSCVDDRCDPPVSCPRGQVCVPTAGTCVEDPCARLTCPGTEVCVDGECAIEVPMPDAGMGADAGVVRVDAGFDAGSSTGEESTHVLGAGALCTARPGNGSGPWALPLVGLALLRLRRPRRAPSAGGRPAAAGGAR